MLRGNAPATMDGKGRLKVPTSFRRRIEDRYGTAFFVTSTDGERVLVYPLPVWEAFEARLAGQPRFNESVQRLRDLLSYYGAEAQMDKQGRIVIQPRLRQSAGIDGAEVAVLGKHDHLEVWNDERFVKRLEANRLSEDDRRILAELEI